ncbi:MAG: DUF4914 family protein [Firmicutes bacterium]|nr:DUF4914 family protein [Bacillota bacterium]
MITNSYFEKFHIPQDLMETIKKARSVVFPDSYEELHELCYGPSHSDRYDVSYRIEGVGLVKEADVIRAKNGPVVNFMEDYMRKRDPDCMRIGDDLPTDKPRFQDIYGYPFADLRTQTLDWLSKQQLILLPFRAGGHFYGYDSLMICPQNAAFFAYALAGMQGYITITDLPDDFSPRSILYVAPPFRHTHFGGRQVVVHNRSEELHEVFSYNLYPGPSAKKGVFSILLDIGEHEGWVTNHASAVLVETPYENEIVFMHEGASGGGKSEMLEDIPKEDDDRVLIGTHTQTGEKYYISVDETCRLHPIADDMVMAHPSFQGNSGSLVIADAEEGWFLRMDGDTAYGSNPEYEKISIHPERPLEFLNMDGVPGATCLPWEHYPDSNGKPCANPRVIIPRELVNDIIPGNQPVEVNIRSFGVRMPPSTAAEPSYGVMGMLQIVPSSLAWVWRLISPRGFKNPSISDTSGSANALKTEGVGSYWPFCTGKKVTQANLLLEQMINTPNTLNILIPNQHIGAYQVGFMGEWLTREYLARRVGQVRRRHLIPARCPLFGYSLEEMKVNGQYIRQTFLRPELQSRLGEQGYDAGARILTDYFKQELKQFDTEELLPLGRQIIQLVMNDAPLEEYLKLTPINNIK